MTPPEYVIAERSNGYGNYANGSHLEVTRVMSDELCSSLDLAPLLRPPEPQLQQPPPPQSPQQELHPSFSRTDVFLPSFAEGESELEHPGAGQSGRRNGEPRHLVQFKEAVERVAARVSTDCRREFGEVFRDVLASADMENAELRAENSRLRTDHRHPDASLATEKSKLKAPFVTIPWNSHDTDDVPINDEFEFDNAIQLPGAIVPLRAEPWICSNGLGSWSPSQSRGIDRQESDRSEFDKETSLQKMRYMLRRARSEETLSKMLSGIPASAKGRRVFADAEALKDRVRDTIHKPAYSVFNFYSTEGVCQRIARSPGFEQATLAVIALNALWIAIDTDHNHEASLMKAALVFQVAEVAFLIFFSGEWLIRFLAFQKKADGFRDSWFIFDTFLVFLMFLDTVVMSIIAKVTTRQAGEGDQNGGPNLGDASILRLVRLIKLVRIARLAHLLAAIPELLILVKGISLATRSVAVTLCLLVLVIYVFGIAFVQLTFGTQLGDAYYSTVGHSMSTLLLHGCFGEDLPTVVQETGGVLPGGSLLLAFVMLAFVLIASLTVMNMLVGVLVDVVATVSKVEKEEITVAAVRTRLVQILRSLDGNRDGAISKEEFEKLLEKPKAALSLQDVGVDVLALVDLGEFLFQDEDEMPVTEFMDIVLQLRGSNGATVRDIVDLRKFMTQEMKFMQERIMDVLGILPTLQRREDRGAKCHPSNAGPGYHHHGQRPGSGQSIGDERSRSKKRCGTWRRRNGYGQLFAVDSLVDSLRGHEADDGSSPKSSGVPEQRPGTATRVAWAKDGAFQPAVGGTESV